MNKIFAIVLIFLLVSCGCLHHLPPSENIVNVKDSVRIEIRDSINWIPKEKIVNITLPNQESNLETSLAKSQAYTDSLGFLHHNLENKECVKTKYVYKDRIQYRDSIQIKEVPYPVEKPVKYIPKFFWGTLVYAVLLTLLLAVKIYLKIKAGAIKLPKLR